MQRWGSVPALERPVCGMAGECLSEQRGESAADGSEGDDELGDC